MAIPHPVAIPHSASGGYGAEGTGCCCLTSDGYPGGTRRVEAPKQSTSTYIDGEVIENIRRATGLKVRVLIVDSFPWDDPVSEVPEREHLYDLLLSDPDIRLDPNDPDPIYVCNFDGNTFVDPVYGHSKFIESIVRRIAPNADIDHAPVMTGFGVSSDTAVADGLQRWWDANGAGEPGIVNMSLGTYTPDDERPIATRAIIDEMRAAGWVFVGSAGNTTSCRPIWPAADPLTIGVGAVGPNGPAHFTNYGNWVNACAPGVDIVASFPSCRILVPGKADSKDPLQLNDDQAARPDPPPSGTGTGTGMGRIWARWSGTSFSTPAVVGALAHAAGELALADGSVSAARLQEAVDNTIHDPALLRLTGLGTVVNVT